MLHLFTAGVSNSRPCQDLDLVSYLVCIWVLFSVDVLVFLPFCPVLSPLTYFNFCFTLYICFRVVIFWLTFLVLVFFTCVMLAPVSCLSLPWLLHPVFPWSWFVFCSWFSDWCWIMGVFVSFADFITFVVMKDFLLDYSCVPLHCIWVLVLPPNIL